MRRKLLIFLSVSVLLAALIPWLILTNTRIGVTEIPFSSARVPAAFDGFRILQISDLHDACFGEDNADLIELCAGTAPDIIVITGDMIDYNRPDPDRSVSAARRLAEIAPVYYVSGNHEASLPAEEYTAFSARLRECGVTVLEDEAVMLTRGESVIRLTGLRDIGMYTDELTANGDGAARPTIAERQALLRDTLTGLLSAPVPGLDIVLSHRPEQLPVYAACGADLMLSGHAHGGQVRIPPVGGLYAPGQGLFPKYTAGLYTLNDTALIVSRGLGNSIFPIRVNDPPELVVITLRTE